MSENIKELGNELLCDVNVLKFKKTNVMNRSVLTLQACSICPMCPLVCEPQINSLGLEP